MTSSKFLDRYLGQECARNSQFRRERLRRQNLFSPQDSFQPQPSRFAKGRGSPRRRRLRDNPHKRSRFQRSSALKECACLFPRFRGLSIVQHSFGGCGDGGERKESSSTICSQEDTKKGFCTSSVSNMPPALFVNIVEAHHKSLCRTRVTFETFSAF